jgi:hypothetical protein
MRERRGRRTEGGNHCSLEALIHLLVEPRLKLGLDSLRSRIVSYLKNDADGSG